MWTSLFPLFIITVLFLSIIMVILGRTLSPAKPDLGKVAPYECGFDPINSPRLPFSFRFFLVAILFLIFDLEIALLLITPISNSISSPSQSSSLLIIFMIILTLGLLYEWVNGGLDWAED
uniref:NADH-ubiquinone oxidoreductase chain 3 n=1 Tax=Amphioplus laevis TaxID=2806440 RepID=A0A888VYW7_9ECHI|nr:NADH dehydrogenase subunit 3 [Amphioplus laevis]QRC36797.1 NADH dehydrogenase subunit 3 [Amphioplus laevis]